MGFIKKNVKINGLDITIPEAYAQIENLSIDLDGNCIAAFKIQTSREAMDKPALETKYVQMAIDKDKPAHKQAYQKAKESIFADWEDDLPQDV